MRLLRCLLTENDCDRAGRTIAPKGIMVHSTGADNPNLKRYVQPLPESPDYDSLTALLGINRNHNDWNRPNVGACVHAFIGRLEDGTLAVCQTLPWTMRGWHCGADGNNTHISFEICEDGLEDPVYFSQAYREAVELTAHLCRLYHLDPRADGVVLCHAEGYRRGIASAHADVEHWFPKFNQTMDDFRADVARELEEDEMTQEAFDDMMEADLARRAQLPPSDWSQPGRTWAEDQDLILGNEAGNQMYQSFVTREELVTILERMERAEQS